MDTIHEETVCSARTEANESNGVQKPKWKVEFAPINVPYERRMQTLAALYWICLFLIVHPGGVVLFAYLFFYTRYWYLTILYISFIYLDRKTCDTGGRKNINRRSSRLWMYYRDYFPIKLVKTADLNPKKNYLLASHPHGVLSSGAFCSFATEALDIGKLYPGLSIHFLTLRLNFLLPIFRELCLSLGMCSVTKESLNYLLSYPGGGKVAVIVPGGASESLDAHSGSYIVRLKNRKGFVKLALQNGVSLVPVFCFGENDIYKQMDNPEGSFVRTIQNKLQKTFSVAPLLVNGRGIFQYSYGLLPKRRPIVTVVGAPLEAKHISHPSQEDIDSHHEAYMNALTKLFLEYRDKYGDSNADIKFV